MLKRKIIIAVIVLVILGLGLTLVLFLNSKPLRIGGYTEYNNSEDKKVYIELVNNGWFDIHLKEVLINNKKPSELQLVISYTGQLVSAGIEDDPLTKSINIDSAPIHPKLAAEEFEEAVKTKTTPINYGIKVNNEETIEVVKIKYKCLGFTFKKEFNLDTWNR
ncbi:MAG: hypothetical protein QM644_12125 [Mobilitalea sp.]